MSRFRSRWLAVFGGVTLITLSLSPAFAGKPDGENRGQQVSAFVHSLVGADEETDEQADEETETEDTETEQDESAPSDHGQCVALVAQDKEAVGPPNDNHGGAVSEAAKVTCWEDAASDESNGEEPSEDDGDSEVESDEDGDSEDSEESEDAEASDSGSDHGNGHDNGHGGDSSDD